MPASPPARSGNGTTASIFPTHTWYPNWLGDATDLRDFRLSQLWKVNPARPTI